MRFFVSAILAAALALALGVPDLIRGVMHGVTAVKELLQAVGGNR